MKHCQCHLSTPHRQGIAQHVITRHCKCQCTTAWCTTLAGQCLDYNDDCQWLSMPPLHCTTHQQGLAQNGISGHCIVRHWPMYKCSQGTASTNGKCTALLSFDHHSATHCYPSMYVPSPKFWPRSLGNRYIQHWWYLLWQCQYGDKHLSLLFSWEVFHRLTGRSRYVMKSAHIVHIITGVTQVNCTTLSVITFAQRGTHPHHNCTQSLIKGVFLDDHRAALMFGWLTDELQISKRFLLKRQDGIRRDMWGLKIGGSDGEGKWGLDL